MGFKDRFTGNETSNVSVKVQCTGCKRITTVRIPSDKTIEKWNEKAICSICGGKSCWEKYV
jgi:rRNA maturation endonuclease Nob1